jgi:hypothetical protein
VVLANERLLVGAAILCPQRAAQEVGSVGHDRGPADGLPVDHHERPRRLAAAEEHVVEPVVPVHEAERRSPILRPSIHARHEALAHLAVSRSHALAVALEEGGEQLLHHRLVEDALLVEPRRGPELRIPEHGRVQTGEIVDREPCPLDGAALDLVALDSGSDVLE